MSDNKNESKAPFNYKIVIAIMAVVIVGLCIGLGISISKKKNDGANNQVKNDEATTEGTSEDSNVEDEATTAEQVDSENKNEEDNKNEAEQKTEESKLLVKVDISSNNGWDNGNGYSAQFDGKINNTSKEDISNWEIKVTGVSGAKIENSWNGTYKIEGDTLSIKSVDYNAVIPASGNIDFGFILALDSQSKVEEVKKNAVLYVDGQVYSNVAVADNDANASSDDSNKNDKDDNNKTEDATNDNSSDKTEVKVESGTAVANHGALSVDGVDLVDKNGEKYQLKGVSTHGIAWFPQYVTKETLQTFRDDWGANLFRIAMYSGENNGYCTGGDKEKLKSLVSNGVDYATELGMYVIIDWHVLGDQNPQTYKSEAIAFFDEMSKKYKDYENVLYEICNEPNGGTTWSDVKSYAEEVIPVIRKNAPNAIIIVGTPTWSQDVDIAANDPIKGYDNVMYTVHFYAATHTQYLRDKLTTARNKGLAIFISEFSICDASGNGAIDYNEADKWMKLINDYNLSYAAWNVSNKNETSSLISSSCNKTSGWIDDELSETGKWLKKQLLGQ